MPVDVPPSNNTVSVKIIDPGCRIHVSPGALLTPHIYGHDDLAAPAYCFLIENEQLGRKIIFDLGLKKEWEKLPTPLVDGLQHSGAAIERGKDVSEILKEGGVDLRGIESVIWR